MTRIAFLGSPEVAVPVLADLAARAPVAAVFCNPDRPKGRGRELQAPPVKAAALGLGLPVHQPTSWKVPETRALWDSLDLDLAIVVAYGHILPAWMLDSLPLGAWNLHFSLLPRWRGAAPVNHAILTGDTQLGVSLMRLEPGLDSGPVLAQSARPITPEDDAEGLLAVLAGDAAALLAEHLPALLEGTAQPHAQDAAQATLAPKLSRDMARLDPTQPAAVLQRRVRALQPWPGTELNFGGQSLKVCAVGALRPTDLAPGTLAWNRGGAWLAAGDGQAVELRLLQRAGKPVQPALQALQPWGPEGLLYVEAGPGI
ncbi:MAG: methionyl-tRNA formyltransferase [Holophagaceae bacterium]|nr:methionyl-tRNA formyltransferase [Holophagaceae bacterium]